MGDDVGVLVVRAWCEPGREPAFRARVLAVSTTLEEVEEVGVATSVSEAIDLVRGWLSESALCH